MSLGKVLGLSAIVGGATALELLGSDASALEFSQPNEYPLHPVCDLDNPYDGSPRYLGNTSRYRGADIIDSGIFDGRGRIYFSGEVDAGDIISNNNNLPEPGLHYGSIQPGTRIPYSGELDGTVYRLFGEVDPNPLHVNRSNYPVVFCPRN